MVIWRWNKTLRKSYEDDVGVRQEVEMSKLRVRIARYASRGRPHRITPRGLLIASCRVPLAEHADERGENYYLIYNARQGSMKTYIIHASSYD